MKRLFGDYFVASYMFGDYLGLRYDATVEIVVEPGSSCSSYREQEGARRRVRRI
ncbi:MAG: hypothetical protein IJQ63_12365 [Synergistaceae bacterium]|nr:hypothetical protein [Synergistaceae bacterium]MBR0096839.1 hypothetical protein [Synergistaceae bacterium]MBR0222552.1 hypothetical protein [Synergistaceae bacterium]